MLRDGRGGAEYSASLSRTHTRAHARSSGAKTINRIRELKQTLRERNSRDFTKYDSFSSNLP